jgi:NADH-quinone oxidoreductase subunit J
VGLPVEMIPVLALSQLAVSPLLLYGACALGAVGVAIALPRKGTNPQVLGGLLAAIALGGVFLALALAAFAGDHSGLGIIEGWSKRGLPNFNFYLFSLIALAGALRVISHPRPVYSALYFILTILSSAGLYVLLAAEFMAFALIIVYAGAILITYLFVIMLATETPTADEVEALAEYDRYSREPAVATAIGFVLVAVLTTMMIRGAGQMEALPVQGGGVALSEAGYQPRSRLSDMPRKVAESLARAGLMDAKTDRIARGPDGEYRIMLSPGADGSVVGRVWIEYGKGQILEVSSDDPRWPKNLALTNTEGVGFSLLVDHPGVIEIAGVVLLMAMLAAVVLARKKVELDEAEKLAAARRHLPSPSALEGGSA